MKSAEGFLRQALDKRSRPDACAPAGAARALESLARLNRKLGPLDDDTDRQAARRGRRDASRPCTVSRRNAMAALVAAQGVDAETLKSALADDRRRDTAARPC